MQIRLDAWVEGIKIPVHNCAFDIFYTEKGILPPCKLSPKDPGYEPIP